MSPTSPKVLRRVSVLPLLLGLAVRAVADEPAPAAPKEPGALALTTERVVVFKDGFGLFVKRAEGTADAEGRVFTEDVPDAAVLGTFWATSSEGKVLAMRAGWHERREVRERETKALTIADVLRANVGRPVVLQLARENAADVEATVEEVLEVAPQPEPSRPASGPAGESVRSLEPQGGAFVVMRQGASEDRTVLPVAEIRTVHGKGLSTRKVLREEVTVRAKRLTLDLGREAAGRSATLRILYFRPGVRWIPTYRLSGDLEERGDLSLQGEVLNEAEDFEGAALDLVVGVPNFRYRDVASPLTLERALRDVLAQQADAQLLAQNMVSNRFFSNDESSGPGVAAPDTESLRIAPDLATAQGQDLFVYRAPSLSLRRGERATLALWQAGVALRHVHTFDLSIVRDGRSGARLDVTPERGSPLRIVRNDVWHQVEIPNGTDVPWTTGAALLLRGDLPLGQEMLGYTPRGGRVLVPVTVAVDVQGGYEEEEIERRPEALRWDGDLFTLVRKRLRVTVTNRRPAPADLRVTVSTGGKASNPSAGGTVRLDDFHAADWGGSGFGPVNNHSRVVWDAAVGPGQTTTFTCEAEIYVR